MSTQLDKYTASVEALKEHQKANEAVFNTHQELMFKVIDAENDLRDHVATIKEGESNGSHKVTFVPQTQTWADIEELEKLVVAGMMTREVFNGIVKTQDRPPRITISEVK